MVSHLMEFLRLEILLFSKARCLEQIRITKKVEMFVFSENHGLIEEIAETLKSSVKNIEEQGLGIQSFEISGKGSSRIAIPEAEREFGCNRWVIVHPHGIFGYPPYPRCEAELIGSYRPQTIIKADSSGE